MSETEHFDLQKLRRFALAIGLVLITYSLALEFDPEKTVSPLGLPFKVIRPELLTIGLMLASGYGLLRYWYYGCLLTASPARVRADLKREVYASCDEDGAPNDPGLELRRRFRGSFPRVLPRRRAFVEVGYEDGGNVDLLRVHIPWEVRLASIAEGVDYTAPIWLNMVALLISAVQLFRS